MLKHSTFKQKATSKSKCNKISYKNVEKDNTMATQKEKGISPNELAVEAQSSTSAFAKLYERYVDKIYSFYFHRTNNNQSTAEDLTSQTFEKVLKNISKYNPDKSNFSTWLYSIAQNNLTDFYRKQQHRSGTPLDDLLETNTPGNQAQTENTGNNSIESIVINDRNSKILNIAISKLSQKDQLAITLKFIQNLTYKETAIALKCSPNAAGVRIHRTLRKLSKILKKYKLHEKLDL